jgi:hypothetical protein
VWGLASALTGAPSAGAALESETNATTVAVDLAKNVFELAMADRRWRIIERRRLTRGQVERWFGALAAARQGLTSSE